jgi:hypothetical protein
MSLSDRAAVTGVGETAYTKASSRSAVALSLEASLTAIAEPVFPRATSTAVIHQPVW